MAFVLSLWLLWRKPAPYARNFGGFRLLTPVLFGLSATALIAFSAYAAWDYHRISQIYLPPAMRSEAYRDNTLQKIGDSRLFRDQVQFAELSITPLTRGNAAHLHELAKSLLHFSPEPRVIESVIESSLLLRHDDEAKFYLVRYRAAFPESHARWVAAK